MTQDKIKRINELYKKEKTEGLTDAEKTEQADLRLEYRRAVVNNMTSQLGDPEEFKKLREQKNADKK